MKTLKLGYYKADSINGVTYLGKYLEDPSTMLESPTTFYDSLFSLSPEDVIYTHFDDETIELLDCIDSEYGIN